MEGNEKEKETEEKDGLPRNTVGETRAGGDVNEKKGRENTEIGKAKEANSNTSASGYVRQLPPTTRSLFANSQALGMKGQRRTVVRNVSERTRTLQAVHRWRVGNVRKGIRSPITRTTRTRTSRSTFSKNYTHQNRSMWDRLQPIDSRSVQTFPST
jgi:hypothetical protein